MSGTKAISVHHSRYKSIRPIYGGWWATSHLGQAFALYVFASTDQSICEENAGAVTARACMQ